MGQIDPTWRSATFSPAGVADKSGLGGCVLVGLTTNGEVRAFEAEKDASRGEWKETRDFTKEIVEDLVNPSQSRSPIFPERGVHACN
jgi:uncharacterized protein YuzE